MGRLQDKVAVITGGAAGIGRAAARLFAREGARVLMVDVDAAALAHAAAQIGSERVSHAVADVADPEQVRAFVRTAVERYGGVDTLLANAGVEGAAKPIVEYDLDVFDRVLNVNVRGVWLCLKHVVPEMQKRGGGSVVITSSIAGVRGVAGMSGYVASKHAVVGIMRSAALEYAPSNIRVNTVNPAPVETRMMRSLEQARMPGDPATAKEKMRKAIPLHRYGEPDEVAKLMLFLASDDSAFVTGAVHMIDGGRAAG